MRRNENPYSIYGEEDEKLRVIAEEPADIYEDNTKFKKLICVALSVLVVAVAGNTYRNAKQNEEKNNESEYTDELPNSWFYTAPAGFTLKIVGRKVMAVKEVRIYPPFDSNLDKDEYRLEYDAERQENYLVQTIMVEPTITYFNPVTGEVPEAGLGK